MTLALAWADLAFRYPDGSQALDGFSAYLEDGECVGLVGPNGAGKTTLLLALAGFLRPQRGATRLYGDPLGPADDERRRRTIGFTFHQPDDQLFMPTLVEDVAFGLRCAKVPQGDAEAQARAMLERFGLGAAAARFPGHLSAGQKRLATLAGVLVMEPRILALDEPTAFLDPYGRRQVIEHLRALPETKLIVTHDLDLVLDLCSRVIVMAGGRAVLDGPPGTVLADDAAMRRHHLEVPPALR